MAGANGSAAEVPAPWANSSLSRSYSEHADLVLQHFSHYRRRHQPEPLKYTRSGPNFHLGEAKEALIRDNEADDEGDDEEDEDEDEEEDGGKNRGQRTWRVSSSTSGDSRPFDQSQRCKIIELGGGDSGALTTDFSELSLQSRSQPDIEAGAVALTPIASTHSFNEFEPFRFIDDVDNENFKLVDSDEFDDVEVDEDDNNGEDGGEELAKPLSSNEEEDDDDFDDQSVTTAAASSTTTTNGPKRLNGQPLKRKVSYEDWARDKRLELQRRKDEARRAEEQRREAEERERREREEKERRDYECFVDWMRRKEREKVIKRELMEKEMELQRKIRDVEQKTKAAKDVCLKQWCRRKEERMKASEKEVSMKKKKAEEERERRLLESMKAYEKWRAKSKNTPRPATQGLLPHQKAKPAFTNPTPWQPLVNNASDDSDGESQINKTTSNAAIKNKKIGVKR